MTSGQVTGAARQDERRVKRLEMRVLHMSGDTDDASSAWEILSSQLPGSSVE